MATTNHKLTSPQRRHAAIMFTDIVGYTSLMGSDEDKAFEVLQLNREIHSKFIEHFNGTLIKEMGDGMLISFDLASKAVRCAIEIQKACKNQEIPLKIGIHEGEMVFEGNDVLGDGVNIASRIQDNAPEGCVLVSNAVYRDVKNKTDISTKYLGEYRFKNVDGPIKIYHVGYECGPEAPAISAIPTSTSSGKKSLFESTKVKISSVVVVIAAIITMIVFNSSRSIPFEGEDWIIITDFENLTGDSIFDQSLNTALEISVQQSVFVNVFPRSRTRETLLRMGKNKSDVLTEETGIEIAEREGMKVMIACGISGVGDAYTLSSKIIEVKTGETLRSATFNANSKNEVLGSLDQLGRKLRKDLGESLKSIDYEIVPLPAATTPSIEALRCLVKAQEAWTIDGKMNQAEELLLEAIRLDTAFAMAHANLGSLYYWMNNREKGEWHFNKALDLLHRLTEKERLFVEARIVRFRGNFDEAIIKYGTYLRKYPNSTEAWFSLGYCLMRSMRNEEAIDAFNKSLEIFEYKDPNALINIASCYNLLQEGEKAISFYRQAFEINPKKLLVPNLNHEYGFAYVQQGEIKKAQDVFQKMIDDTEDNSARGYRSMALLDMYCGKYGDAIQNLQKSSLINKIHGIGVSEFRDRLFMAIAYRAKGKHKEFINELQKAEELLKTEGLEPWWYFLAGKLYIREGNTKKAEAILVEISSRINDGNRMDQAVHDILLGEIEQIRGNNTRARELFESSFNLRNDAIALESLANHYFIHDDFEIAITKYQEIFKLNCLGWEAQEYWIRAHYKLANLYEQKGEKEQAINYYQALLKIWKDADEDIPELVAAKGHLANLIN